MDTRLNSIFNETWYKYDDKIIIKCSITSNELSLLIDKFFYNDNIVEVEIYRLKLSIGENENWNYRLKKIFIWNIEPNINLPIQKYYIMLYNHLIYNMCSPFNCKIEYGEYVGKKFVDITINDKIFYCFSDALKQLNN